MPYLLRVKWPVNVPEGVTEPKHHSRNIHPLLAV